MKIAIILVFAFCMLGANAFFGTKAPLDGCNPDPCKNKAECVKDTKNPMALLKCNCKPGYYGVHCENKDGCLGKPCKSGECIVNSLDKSKFTCKCPNGKVGQKCEKADECAKNPCKNDGVCKLDAKLKAVCTCQNGFTSKNCDKKNCPIVEFKGKHFAKTPKIYIDKAVEGKFKKFDDIAKKCGVTVQQSKSYATQANVKLPVDLANAPHYNGRALTFELTDALGKPLCNELCLSKKPVPQKPAQCFLDGVRAEGWLWEQDKNPILIHDGSFKQPLEYSKLRETAQIGCKDKKF